MKSKFHIIQITAYQIFYQITNSLIHISKIKIINTNGTDLDCNRGLGRREGVSLHKLCKTKKYMFDANLFKINSGVWLLEGLKLTKLGVCMYFVFITM